jgi:hypothetical protein
LLTGQRIRIESAELRQHDTGRGRIGSERGPVIEDRVAVGVAPGGDVERGTSAGRDERRQGDAAPLGT